MIPPVIHQTWKDTSPPHVLSRLCDTWKQQNPGAAYRFYDDAACRDLVRREFPGCLDAYDRLPFAVQRADFFRYLVVYRYGGLYADVDMECLKPFERFFALRGAVFSIEARMTAARQRELGYLRPFQIANCIFAAEPSDPFLGHVIDRIVALVDRLRDRSLGDVEDVTGPRMLTRAFFEAAPASVTVVNQIYWIPPREYPRIYPLNKNMYARHHFMGSWKEYGPRRFRRVWIERNIPPTPFPKTVSHHISRARLADL